MFWKQGAEQFNPAEDILLHIGKCVCERVSGGGKKKKTHTHPGPDGQITWD